jgi:hypothetical protein
MTMPAGSEVVSITHADPEGERYAEVIRDKAVEALVAASLPFRVQPARSVLKTGMMSLRLRM